MKEYVWSFDPSSLHQRQRGGNPTGNAFLDKASIDTLVRETLQNAYDQKAVHGDGPVEVTFGLHTLTGDSKDAFLSALNWSNDLEPTMWDVIETGQFDQEHKSKLRETLESVYSDPLWLLNVSDSGTNGLTGSDDEDAGNFKLLCINEMVTQKDNSNRGGSTGVGKSILTMFSGWSTLLYATRVPSEEAKRIEEISGQKTYWEKYEFPLRIFGRVDFPSFSRSDGAGYEGPGFFGLKTFSDHPVFQHLPRSSSCWGDDAEELAADLRLSRPESKGAGTSVVVVGFKEPMEVEEESTSLLRSRIADDLGDAAGRWFWPAMDLESRPLNVRVDVFDNEKIIGSREVEVPEDFVPFRSLSAASGDTDVLQDRFNTVEQSIPFRVPRLKAGISANWPDGHPTTSSAFTLKICLARPDDENRNKVALLRGRSGFVLDYRDIRARAERPYFAVLLGGLARGTSEEDRVLEDFLWRAEPPAHDDWSAGRPELKDRYDRGATKAFSDLWTEIRRQIRQAIEGPVQAPPPGASRLSRLFRIRGPGGPPAGRPVFRSNLSAVRDGDLWEFKGSVTGPGDPQKRWAFEVSVYLDEEGRATGGTAIPISSLEIIPDDCEMVSSGEGEGPALVWRCTPPPGCQKVDFTGQTIGIEEIMGNADARRTRLRLNVQQRLQEV